MKLLHLQLHYNENQLTLHIETDDGTQEFTLEGPVSNPQELAYQAELFVGIHVRPYFDLLPVESCKVSLAGNVPKLVRDCCLSELVKVTQTNDLLTTISEDTEDYLASDQRSATSSLCIYSESMPLEGLLLCADVSQQSDHHVIGYLPTQEPETEDQQQLRTFSKAPEAWFQWYLKQNCNAIVCGQDFVSEFEQQGVVLSAVLASVGHALVIIESPFSIGQPMAQYQKRASDSAASVHLVQDERSLVWGRWLGLNNLYLGSLKSQQYKYNPQTLSFALKEATLQSVALERSRELGNRPHQSGQQNVQLLLCEDLHLRRVLAWLPQAYHAKKLLDDHFNGSMSGIVATELWMSVMRRLIVGSNESTDYDVIILVRRLELIAEVVQSLQLIDFVQQLDGKADVLLCGHPDWETIFPAQYAAANQAQSYKTGDWFAACEAFPNATLLMAEPVFNPLLSKKCVESIYSGQSVACFSSGLYQMDSDKTNTILGLGWLEQHVVSSADGCCVHAMSTTSDRDTMVQKRQEIIDALSEHNQLASEQVLTKDWFGEQSKVAQSIDAQLESWHGIVEQFYNDNAQLFHDSLMVLNPQTEMKISDELRVNPPEYLVPLLQLMVFPEDQARTGA